MTESCAMVLKGVPPSVNHAYGQRHGKRFLTTEGKAYKNETKTFISRNYATQLLFVKKNEKYAISIVCYFEELENKTWPEKVDDRYKKLDATNRVKLLEDALVEAVGIDDSHFFQVTVTKRHVSKSPSGKEETHIWLWKLLDE